MKFPNLESWCSYFLTLILIYVSEIISIETNKTREHTQNGLSSGNFSGDSSNVTFDHMTNSSEVTRPHYALNPKMTHILALWEEYLVTNLTQVISNASVSTQNTPCHLRLEKYISDFHKDIDPTLKMKERANLVMENPILTLRMIRRVLVDLQNDTKSACQNSIPEVVNIIESVFGENLTPVSSQDLDDALLGLLRIQFIYGFNATNETRLGIFNSVKTGASLDPEDCLALANKAIEIEAVALAYQWLVSASLSRPQKQAQYEYTQNGSCIALESEADMSSYYVNGELEPEETLLWIKLLNLTKAQTMTELHEMLRNKRQNQMKEKFFMYPKYATCRGESRQTTEQKRMLVCYYARDSNPYFYINPLKTEMLSKDPRILQFYELVGDQTIKLILNFTTPNMRRSGVISLSKPQVEFDTFRTSVNGWLRDTEKFKADKKLVALNRRIEKLTGLEVFKQYASECQVALYGSLGGHYDFHDDSMQDTARPIDHRGDRIATALFFLSDVTMGGYTGFPRFGVFAKPQKGSAVLWYNLRRNGTKDRRLEHGGCPVILGTKLVANRWILQNENMWKHPCLLDPLA